MKKTHLQTRAPGYGNIHPYVPVCGQTTTTRRLLLTSTLRFVNCADCLKKACEGKEVAK